MLGVEQAQGKALHARRQQARSLDREGGGRSLAARLEREAQALPGAPGKPPGTILRAERAGLELACGQGRLRVTRLQPAGRNAQSVAEALNARRDSLAPGRVLGAEPDSADE